MGLLETIFGKQAQKTQIAAADGYFKTLTAYAPVFTSWGGEIYESLLVRSAIDARARHASKLRIDINGAARPTLQTKLKQAPNGWMTWGKFLYRTCTILDMQNTCFIVPVIGEFGEVTGICPILPSRCEILDYKGSPWIRYQFSNGQNAAIALAEVAILTKFQYEDDFFGSSNNALRSTMSLIDLQNQGIKEAVKSGATYRFMAQVNNFTKDSDLEKERKRFSERNLSKDSEGGGILLFPNTYSNIQQIKASPYTVDADQMQLIQNNVYDYFGVNEDILQNKAYGDAWAAFYEGAIEPFSIQLSDVLTQMLFSQREIAQGALIMATANRLQYMSTTEKLNVSQGMADRGIMNRDEIREIWNLPPLPDGAGKAYTIRGEYYLLGEDGTATKKNDDDGGNNDE